MNMDNNIVLNGYQECVKVYVVLYHVEVLDLQ